MVRLWIAIACLTVALAVLLYEEFRAPAAEEYGIELGGGVCPVNDCGSSREPDK